MLLIHLSNDETVATSRKESKTHNLPSAGTVAFVLLVDTTSPRVFNVAVFLFQKHISDLLRSKLTSFANFHTMLYTCAVEFDFMEREVRRQRLRLTAVLCACSSCATALELVQQNVFASFEQFLLETESKSKKLNQWLGDQDLFEWDSIPGWGEYGFLKSGGTTWTSAHDSSRLVHVFAWP